MGENAKKWEARFDLQLAFEFAFFTLLITFWFTFAFWFALFSHFQLHFDLHLHFGLLCFRIFNYISFTCAFPGWTLAALLAHFELFLDNGFCSSFAPPRSRRGYVNMCLHKETVKYMNKQTRVHIYIYEHLYIYIHTYIHTFYMYIYTYIHIYIYIHIFIYTDLRPC